MSALHVWLVCIARATFLPSLHVQIVCLARTASCICHRSSLPWNIRFINDDNSPPVQHYVFICVIFPGRDLRFNNISIIEDGDLADLRHLTTLWVFLCPLTSPFVLLGDVHGSCTLVAMFLSAKFIIFTDFLAGIISTQSKLRLSVDCRRSNICK